jgi:hypothetical protein
MNRLDELLVPGDSLLVALPTAETFRRFQQILSGSPIDISWDELCLEIAIHDDAMLSTDARANYACKFVKFGILYNEDLNRTQLAGYVQCSSLQERRQQLGLDPVEAFLVVFSDSAELARSNKSFCESVSYTLCAKEHQAFTFGPEMLLTA